jgi:hypothetical protein
MITRQTSASVGTVHTLTAPLSVPGQEYLWREVWRELGLTDYEIQTSFDGPASLSWSRTYEAAWQNGGVFSPNGTFEHSLDEGFLVGQHALQKQIVSRQRALGIGSVLPAFSGKVPGQLKKLFPNATMSGVGDPGPAWIAGTDPLFANISISFLTKAIADFGRTGFYEADGYFTGGPAPWFQTSEAAVVAGDWRQASSSRLGAAAPGGAGSGCLPAATIAESARAAPQAIITESEPEGALHPSTIGGGPLVVCEYGPMIPGHYIPGYAAAGGATFSSLAKAKAACSLDIRCGGALSRSCDEASNGTAGCQLFQTRSGECDHLFIWYS